MITRCMVPFAVLLQERCADGVRVLLRELLSSQRRLRVCGSHRGSGGHVRLERAPRLRFRAKAPGTRPSGRAAGLERQREFVRVVVSIQ